MWCEVGNTPMREEATVANRYPVGSMHWAAEVARTWHAAQAAKRSQAADRARRERVALAAGAVGYLKYDRGAWRVVCLNCACRIGGGLSRDNARIWGVNIYPYHQSCYVCSRVLVVGQSSAWCEAYSPAGVSDHESDYIVGKVAS